MASTKFKIDETGISEKISYDVTATVIRQRKYYLIGLRRIFVNFIVHTTKRYKIIREYDAQQKKTSPQEMFQRKKSLGTVNSSYSTK